MVLALRPVVCVVQARMTSTRLPGKILKPLAGEPLIRRMLDRVLRIEGLDAVVVALAEGAEHDAALPALDGMGVSVVRGPERDVLARTVASARSAGAATVMRTTSDCPMIDPHVSAAVLAAYLRAAPAGIRYARAGTDTGFPHGFDTEVVAADALFEAEAEAVESYDREHVTPFVRSRPERFPALTLSAQPDRHHWRLVVDTPQDYRLAAAIYETLFAATPGFGYPDLVRLFSKRPELLAINAANAPAQT